MDINVRNIDATLWYRVRLLSAARDITIREGVIEALTEWTERNRGALARGVAREISGRRRAALDALEAFNQ